MATIRDLNPKQKKMFNDLYGVIIHAINPDDSGGHAKNCGYTYESPACDCLEMGKRLHEAIATTIVSWE